MLIPPPPTFPTPNLPSSPMKVIKFMQMLHHGHGVSRAFARNALTCSLDAGGENVHLPPTLESCEELLMEMIESLQGKRKTYQLDVPTPAEVKELVSESPLLHFSPSPLPPPFPHPQAPPFKLHFIVCIYPLQNVHVVYVMCCAAPTSTPPHPCPASLQTLPRTAYLSSSNVPKLS
jgi:hypothetical protein